MSNCSTRPPRASSKEEGLPLLVDLMASTDLDAQHAAMAATGTCAHDPGGGGDREAEGLRPLATSLERRPHARRRRRRRREVRGERGEQGAAPRARRDRAAAADALGRPGADVLSSALGAPARCATARMRRGSSQLQVLRRVLPLYDKHDRVASLAAQFFYEVSPNAEVKVAMRLSDARPPIAPLSSPWPTRASPPAR